MVLADFLMFLLFMFLCITLIDVGAFAQALGVLCLAVLWCVLKLVEYTVLRDD